MLKITLMEPSGSATGSNLSTTVVSSDTEEETKMNEINQEVIIIQVLKMT